MYAPFKYRIKNSFLFYMEMNGKSYLKAQIYQNVLVVIQKMPNLLNNKQCWFPWSSVATPSSLCVSEWWTATVRHTCGYMHQWVCLHTWAEGMWQVKTEMGLRIYEIMHGNLSQNLKLLFGINMTLDFFLYRIKKQSSLL